MQAAIKLMHNAGTTVENCICLSCILVNLDGNTDNINFEGSAIRFSALHANFTVCIYLL